MKRFSIQQIQHKWILAISVVIFFSTYLIDLMSPREKPVSLFIIGCVLATLVAAVWAIVNYISHLQVNPLYKTDNEVSNRQPIFQSEQHQYLCFWGGIGILVGVIIFIFCLHPSFRLPIVVDIGATLTAYGAGFYLTFFMYLLLDWLLGQK
ncbi:hypothetical protein [Companilactobacillus ginsenosidimutans]|uniref:MotA/TolQ/ExbB proton channel domain-containing protein n=1 Tax=Companilactobacillus ginsenosidimutans TaxID=1007676 RepID=A0A0H4QKY0_9LACO|nr:hypothetical protein [Companilactobacillus ginsenosidimutans]AKP67373.1 hypothetical protein ABM34_07360 [Companilactobacillus ginsenosidimutans]